MPKSKSNSFPVDVGDLACRAKAVRLTLHEIFGKEDGIYSVEYVAALTGVDAATIVNIEEGCSASLRSLAALAFAYRVTLDWLAGLTPLSEAIGPRRAGNRIHKLTREQYSQLSNLEQFYEGHRARQMRSAINSRLPPWLQIDG